MAALRWTFWLLTEHYNIEMSGQFLADRRRFYAFFIRHWHSLSPHQTFCVAMENCFARHFLISPDMSRTSRTLKFSFLLFNVKTKPMTWSLINTDFSGGSLFYLRIAAFHAVISETGFGDWRINLVHMYMYVYHLILEKKKSCPLG